MDGSERLVIYRGIISMENGIQLKNLQVIKINYLLNIFYLIILNSWMYVFLNNVDDYN